MMCYMLQCCRCIPTWRTVRRCWHSVVLQLHVTCYSAVAAPHMYSEAVLAKCCVTVTVLHVTVLSLRPNLYSEAVLAQCYVTVLHVTVLSLLPHVLYSEAVLAQCCVTVTLLCYSVTCYNYSVTCYSAVTASPRVVL